MATYPDVLDHLGQAPRELGPLHIFVEPVVRGPTDDAIATVWLQAALEPVPPGGILRIFGQQEGAREVQRGLFRIPLLHGGRVLRWRVPLELPEDVAEVHFKVELAIPEEHERVRPAWKLLDTLEIPTLMEIEEYERAMRERDEYSTGPEPQLRPAKWHKARQLPPWFIARVVPGAPERLPQSQVEVVWEPGRPLPEPPPEPFWKPPEEVAKAQAPHPQGGTRRCFWCGFEGPLPDYAFANFCPGCGSTWK